MSKSLPKEITCRKSGLTGTRTWNLNSCHESRATRHKLVTNTPSIGDRLTIKQYATVMSCGLRILLGLTTIVVRSIVGFMALLMVLLITDNHGDTQLAGRFQSSQTSVSNDGKRSCSAVKLSASVSVSVTVSAETDAAVSALVSVTAETEKSGFGRPLIDLSVLHVGRSTLSA